MHQKGRHFDKKMIKIKLIRKSINQSFSIENQYVSTKQQTSSKSWI